jgi:WD40 repeat protein
MTFNFLSFMICTAACERKDLYASDMGPDQESAPAAQAPNDARTLVDLYGDPLPPGAIARLGSIQLRHAGLGDLDFSVDGKTLISAGRDRELRIWDVASAKLTRKVPLRGDLGPTTGTAMSADGKLFAGHDAASLIIWDAESGQELSRLPAPTWAGRPSHLHFSADGQALVGADLNLTEVRIWKWKILNEMTLKVPRPDGMFRLDSTTHLAVSPNGRHVATSPHMSEPLIVWDAVSGKQLCKIEVTASVSAFSPGGELLGVVKSDLAAQNKSSLCLYGVPAGNLVKEIPLSSKGFFWWIAFSLDGATVLPVDTEGMYAFDIRSGKEMQSYAVTNAGRQRMACYSPDGRVLASMGAGRIRLWDTKTGTELNERAGSIEPVYGVAYSPDGRILATGAWVEPRLHLWDSTTGRSLRALNPKWDTGYVRQLAFSKDGQTLVVSRHAGEIAFLNAATGQIERTLRLPNPRPKLWAETHYYYLSPDGQRAVTVDRIVSNPERVQVSVWGTNPVELLHSESFSEIGKRAYANLSHGIAFITPNGIMSTDAANGSFKLLVAGDWSAPLASSPAGTLLAAPEKLAGAAQSIHVWDAATGKTVVQIKAAFPMQMALTPDERTLLTCDGSGLHLWDLASNSERHTIAFPKEFRLAAAGGPGSMSFVRALVVSPDSRQATTALEDGTLLVWSLPAR